MARILKEAAFRAVMVLVIAALGLALTGCAVGERNPFGLPVIEFVS